MENKKSYSALDTYNNLVEELNGDTQKVKEYIDNRLATIKEEKNEWGKYMMTNYWNQVKNHSLKTTV
jgi:hypothetical protein